ncbi:fasciclin-like arabinogalactan protein 21 [Lactuca sativa]|uniref:fasciclin-like arabinogalactan protein 21 n=1 Tax=Lactuca sativa TaxID=4236 RepID=UPI001C68B443|nr:fasciclin-like arabinogalactan protein 21 [Lactuca sativa]
MTSIPLGPTFIYHHFSNHQSNGFNSIATFLRISLDLFLSTPKTTIFTISYSTISNLSILPYMTKHFLAYHISLEKLTLQDMFIKPIKACSLTLIQHQKVSITKNSNKHQVLEVNNVSITHPKLLLQGPAIHDIEGLFASFHLNQESITLPACESGGGGDRGHGFIKSKEEWGRVVKFLISSRFMSFAIVLKSMIQGILKNFPDLGSVSTKLSDAEPHRQARGFDGHEMGSNYKSNYT